MIKHLVFCYKTSIRKACTALRFNRSTFHYRERRDGQAFLRKRIREIAHIRVKYGYRRIHTLLQREGWQINHKRVLRLYQLEDLQMRNKKPKRKVSSVVRKKNFQARKKNEIWSMDFMSDQLFDGKKFRLLTIVDNFTRESLYIGAEAHFKGIDVVQALSKIIKHRNKPQIIKVDNGPEFISKDLDLWAYANQVKLDFSRPGRPTDNAFIESFTP